VLVDVLVEVLAPSDCVLPGAQAATPSSNANALNVRTCRGPDGIAIAIRPPRGVAAASTEGHKMSRFLTTVI
jgi:hypothetical protein